MVTAGEASLFYNVKLPVKSWPVGGFRPVADGRQRAHESKMSKNPPKPPQEKKALSYAHDRRNGYGENDKASRTAIPARKAGENRKVRRKANQALQVAEQVDEDTAAGIESSLRHDVERVGGWTKSPDIPLRDFMELQARRRSWRDLPPTRRTEPDRDGG